MIAEEPPEDRRWRTRLKWPLPIGLIIITTVAVVLTIVLDRTEGWGSGFAGVAVVSGTFAVLFLLDALGKVEGGLQRPTAENRVKKLTDALTEANKVIAEIEKEVKTRTKLAERLQADVQRHQELLKLNRAEVEAVAQTFRMEVKSEGRRAFRLNLVVSAVFFGLGVAATLLLTS